MKCLFVLLACLTVVASSGCGKRVSVVPSGRAPQTESSKRKADTESHGNHNRTSVDKQKTSKGTSGKLQVEKSWLPPLPGAGATTAVGAAASSWAGGSPFGAAQAIDRIEREVRDALSVRATIVVWIFDQSAAASTLRRAVAGAVVQLHSRIAEDASSKAPSKAGPPTENTLQTAIIAFGSKVNVLTESPIADADKLPDPAQIAEEPGPSNQAYAAIHRAAELYAPLRTHGHEVIFVLVAGSATADEASFTSSVAILNKAVIPIFGIAPAAPFGRLSDSWDAATNRTTLPVVYESLFPERIQLFLPNNEGDGQLGDSGYGPFHVERICRATSGSVLRIRDEGSAGWATGANGQVEPELLRKYAPDYVTEEEYTKILSENRACRALSEAAKLPPARVLIVPAYDFRKQEEAAMNRTISMSQRAPAENQAALELLHQTLAAGVEDRLKLARPRWQAGFDLAFGRACAARARNEGYNHMLAVLKNGRAFTKPESTTWTLKPADGIAGRSDLDKMAKNAKEYLTRVVKDHAGTPWAAMAARELETPCGWEWTER
jgi:hypothetical protein